MPDEKEPQSTTEEEGAAKTVDAADDSTPEDDEAAQQITLDRYLSKRRGKSHAGWPQLVSMILMLVMLIMIIAYKDRCGDVVSSLMGDLDGESTSQQPSTIQGNETSPR